MAATSRMTLIRQFFSTLTRARQFDNVLSTMNVVEAANGRCVCEMKITEEHQNRTQTLHGGMTATLVDVVSTFAMMSNEPGEMGPGVSVDMSISYLRPGKIGEEIIIDAKTVKIGKLLAFLSVEIKNKANSKLIATGTHTKYVGGPEGKPQKWSNHVV